MLDAHRRGGKPLAAMQTDAMQLRQHRFSDAVQASVLKIVFHNQSSFGLIAFNSCELHDSYINARLIKMAQKAYLLIPTHRLDV